MVVVMGSPADKQGRVAGTNNTGGEVRFRGVLGTAITRFQALELTRTGLTEREAGAAEFDTFGAITEAPSPAHHHPGCQARHIKVVAKRKSGRLLGEQSVGDPGVGKRIDVLITALCNEMSLDDPGGMDRAYLPLFAPV